MPLELDPQSLKEYGQKLVAWIKANPIPAALAGGLTLTSLLFFLVVMSLFKDNVTPEKVSLAEDEPNLCKRLRKLGELEPSLQKRGMSVEYNQATNKVFQALLGETPTPDDLALLDQVARQCDGMQNNDMAWSLAIEARMRKGIWPSRLTLPPNDSVLRERFQKTLDKVPTATIRLPTEAAFADAWFKFAAGEAPVLEPILDAWANAADQQTRNMRVYQAAVRLTPGQPIIETTFDKLGLLRKPLYVIDTAPQAASMPASQPSSQPASLPAAVTPVTGPQGTLVFLGVLSGEVCALAGAKAPFPPLVERSCRGLVPRRLETGEIFLLPSELRTATGTKTRLLPAVLNDDGTWLVGQATKDKVEPALLSTFVATARLTGLGGASIETPSNAANDNVPMAFELKQSKVPPIIGFSAELPFTIEKKCPPQSKERCVETKTENTRKCDIAPAVCLSTPSGRTLRYARMSRLETETCIQEYGVKSTCPKTDITGLWVDIREPGATDFSSPVFHVLSFDN